MAIEPWRIGTVIKIIDETYNTKRYFIRVNELESFDFKAGQFVTLDLPIHEQKNKRWRSYSIASWPDGTNVYELLIVLLEGGAGTTYLFNEVSVGSEITFRGPQGVFTLPENIEKDLFFICTGTGIAPFRAFLEDRKASAAKGRNWLFFGNPHAATDSLYQDEIEGYLADGTLSRLDAAWSRDQQEKLYVQHLMQTHGAELWSWLEGGAVFYVCGDASRMAKDVDRTLHQVAEEHGKMSSEEAAAFVSQLKKEKRYLRDVY